MARPIPRTPLMLTGIEQAIRAAIPPGEYEIVFANNLVTEIPHSFHEREVHVELNIKLIRRYVEWKPTVKQVIAEKMREEVTEPERRIVFAEQP